MGVTGHKQIDRDFRDYAKGVEKGLKKKFLKWVNKLANDAQRHCPVKTGAGRTSIHGMVEKSGGTLTGVYGSNAKHLVHIEFGTSRIKVGTREEPLTTWPAKEATDTQDVAGGAQETMPFMRVAWEENKTALGKDLKNIGKEVKLKGKKI